MRWAAMIIWELYQCSRIVISNLHTEAMPRSARGCVGVRFSSSFNTDRHVIQRAARRRRVFLSDRDGGERDGNGDAGAARGGGVGTPDSCVRQRVLSGVYGGGVVRAVEISGEAARRYDGAEYRIAAAVSARDGAGGFWVVEGGSS